jgi:DNA-binding SARP family transcriptional activator
MKIELFNGLCVRVGTQTITRFRSQKTAELLAHLAFYPQRMHSREVLIGLLWPEFDTAAARKSLRVALSSLRHQLEPPGVAPGSIIIAILRLLGLNAEGIATDVADFESALEAGSRASNPPSKSSFFAGHPTLPRGIAAWLLQRLGAVGATPAGGVILRCAYTSLGASSQ